MNKVILMGNLTRDPEMKYLQSGTAVTNFGLAMNERYTDRETGEQRENVCFVECEAWNRQAEVINEYFSKGSQILLEGSLKFEEWEGTDGQKRNRLRVRVQRFEFTGARQDGENRNGNGNGSRNRQTPTPTPTETAPTQTTETDDDIPF